MTRLTVFYDARCGLCCAVRDWLARQPTLVPLVCQPKSEAGTDLVVQADSGEIWSGDDAWLMVLWALTNYRAWSYRLADPLVRPAARRLFASLSAYRGAISCSLALPAEVR